MASSRQEITSSEIFTMFNYKNWEALKKYLNTCEHFMKDQCRVQIHGLIDAYGTEEDKQEFGLATLDKKLVAFGRDKQEGAFNIEDFFNALVDRDALVSEFVVKIKEYVHKNRVILNNGVAEFANKYQLTGFNMVFANLRDKPKTTFFNQTVEKNDASNVTPSKRIN